MRVLKGVILAAAVLLVGGAPAGAVDLVSPDGSIAQPYQHWADLSHVPTVDEVLPIDPDMSTCDALWHGVRACIEPLRGAIHLRDARCGLFSAQAWRKCRFTVMHEVGHQFEYRMPDWKRNRFAPLVFGAPPWASSEELSEGFADVYAMCSMGTQFPIDASWTYPGISARNFRRACHLIRIPN